MKRILSLALLITTITTATTLGQAVQTITLQDAVQIALENNYLLKQAENNLDLAEKSIMNEYGDFLPSINGSLSGSRTTGQQFIFERFNDGLDPFVDITSQSISGSLNLGIDIFSGFSNINSLRASQLTKLSREESLIRARESVIFNTATRYLQVLLSIELLEIAQENLETSRTQLEQVTAQVEVGSRPAVDQYNQEAQVANDELSVTQQENSLNLNRLTLIRQLQIDPLGNYEFVVPEIDGESAGNASYSLRTLINEALSGRSDIRSEEATIDAQKLQLQIAKGALLPSLRATAGISSRYSDQYSVAGEDVNFSDQFFDQQVNRSLGLSLNIPIFNNWSRVYNIQSQQVQLKNAELALDNTKLQVIQEVTQAFNDYSSYVKQLDASEKSRVASEKAFETQQERYNVGASTLIELSQAQANFVSAQSNYTQALYNLIFQEKLLDFYLGKLSGETVEF